MITLNSTILSYNKVNEIEEFKPVLPPDSIDLPEELNNRSFQNFIPGLYDLDMIAFNTKKFQRNSTPIINNKIKLKNYFLTSIIMNQIDKRDKLNESISINIYSNNQKENEKNNNHKINRYNNEKNCVGGDKENKNIFENQKKERNIYNKVNNDNKKFNSNSNSNNNDKRASIKKSNKEENVVTNNKNDFLIKESNKDISDCQQNNLNKYKNNNKIKKIYKKTLLEEQSENHSKIVYNYKNIIRRDPLKENEIIINTSFYKRNKHKKGINYRNNNRDIKSEYDKNSYFNSFGKSDESIKAPRLSELNINDKNQKRKEEILRKFRELNNNNINLNDSKSEQNNLTNLISNTNNSNIDENEKVYEEKNTFPFHKLNNYGFKPGKTNINNNIIKNNNILNINNEQKIKNINIKFNNSPSSNNSNNYNSNGNILQKKPTVGLQSFKKFNFDFPKILRDKYNNNEQDNKAKSFIINANNNNLKNEKNIIKIENQPIIHIKFKNLKKISKNKGLFNILTFLDSYDIMNLLQTNKSLIFLINRAITDAYYHTIKNKLNKFKSDFELLNCSLVYSKIKDFLKIDFVIKIRFLNKLYNKNKNNNFFSFEKEKKIEPKCFQVIYFYKFFKSKLPLAKLKTKENSKKEKMYDFYTYDLYSDNDIFPNIYINKENSSFNNNITDKLVFVQPILPFKINDKGIINFEIYSSNNEFINPSSIRIILKSFDLKQYLNNLKAKGYNNSRLCEYENIGFHWKYINKENNINNFKDIILKIKNNFEPYFEILNIYYETIGFLIFKINLVAIKAGKIDNKDFGVNIIIRNKNDVVENEIKKNNLIFERRVVYELRVGDTLTFYLSTKKLKNN